MSKKQDRINLLAEEVFKHRNLYYNQTPIISDEAFDLLLDELKSLSPDHPAITDVGYPIEENTEWKKATHNIKMGSLNKINSSDEIKEWVFELFKPNNSIFYSEKIDGISIECCYEDGKFTQAITRGNGTVGLDISSNVILMGGVKKVLPTKFTGSLRGEILLKKSKHKKYFPDAENPRNAASGLSSRLDGVGCEHLDILFYQAIGDVDLTSEFLQLKFLQEDLGLNVPNYNAYAGKTIDELVNFIAAEWKKYQDKTRDSLDYLIDGLVICINDLEYQNSIKEKHNRPWGKLALKFPNQLFKTTVKSIDWTLGRGRITPRCWFDKINILGSNVEKASVYNIAYIKKLGLGIGSEVYVCKAGEIIPRVESVLTEGLPIDIPTKCPACSGPLEMQGENLTCVSTDTCPAQLVGRLSNWISSLGILEWGEALLQRLIDTEKVRTVADLYKLSVADLAALERMGAKSAKKCYDSLRSQTTLSLDTFLGSLSIPLVAKATIKMVMDAGYDSLDKILSMSKDDLLKVKGIGEVKAELFSKGLRRNKELISELLEVGIKIESKNMSGKLVGMNIAITGATNIKRDDLVKIIEENGGTFSSNVGKKTSHLIIADPGSQSSKAVKARDAGVKLISEDDFLAMIK